jgi:hypothetical protein
MVDRKQWSRTPEGKIILRLIEEWEAGITEHGDIVLSFSSSLGNDPAAPPGEMTRSQFICTQQDAKEIARMLLRTLAFTDLPDPADFNAFHGRMRSPSLQAVARHWNMARGTRRMPSWSDLQPDGIAPHLGFLWGYDYDPAAEIFTGRLSGSNIVQGFGRTFLGASLQTLYQPHVVEILQSVLIRIVSEPACVRFSGNLFRAGEQVFQGERLMLPMGADADHPDGVLGVSHWDDTVAPASDSFEVLFDRADWCKV